MTADGMSDRAEHKSRDTSTCVSAAGPSTVSSPFITAVGISSCCWCSCEALNTTYSTYQYLSFSKTNSYFSKRQRFPNTAVWGWIWKQAH